MESLVVTLPESFPTPDDGVGLVELVEAALLAPTPTLAFREVAPAEVVHRNTVLVDEIRKRGWLSKDDASNFVAALLTWRGGIGMAKTLRDVDAAGTTYTLAHRRAEYALLEAEWNQRGGNWVRYGASLARSLELGRTRESQPEWVPPDDWVPADSPYWGSWRR